MPDTGAPWNIPYVAPTDNPRVYPAADEAQALAIAAGLTTASVIRQVVQTVKTDTFSTTSTSNVTITGLEVTITPAANTHKVLLIATVNASDVSSGTSVSFQLAGGNATSFVGDAAGSRIRAAAGYDIQSIGGNDIMQRTFVYLDSPATTSATTYAVQIRTNTAGTVQVNRSRTDSDGSRYLRTASSITAIEVQA
jgi:hypothetical protein